MVTSSSNPFVLIIIIIIIIIITSCCFGHHLTAAEYNYKSPLNLTVALTVLVPFGTPTQMQRVVLDTGSQLTWLQCRSAVGRLPSFCPDDSSSFSNIHCNDSVCLTDLAAQTSDLSLPMTCRKNLCRYTCNYADMTTSKGNLVREKSNLSLSSISSPSLVMGCSRSKDLFTGADGMLGMNRGNLSYVSQLNITKFSYCVPNLVADNNSAGTFYIGDSPYSESFRYTGLLNISKDSQPIASSDTLAYYVNLVGIHIRGEKLKIKYKERFADYPGQTMIDSGTKYTYLVEAAYAAVRNKVVSLTGKYMISPIPEFDMCYNKSNSNLTDIVEEIGDVVFEFEDGVNVTIAKETILRNITEPCACVAFGRSDKLGGITTNVFGFLYQQGHCLEFGGGHVGFGKAAAAADDDDDSSKA